MPRPQNHHLHFDRQRVVLNLVEQLDDAFAALQLRLSLGVEIGTELRKRRQFAELRQVALDAAGDLFHRLDLRRRTDARHGQAHRNRRADALIKQIRFQINLPVGDGNHVRGNVSRNVARLGFDDGQRRDRAVAVFFGHARAAFQQAAVQVKHVARIRLAARRTLEHE